MVVRFTGKNIGPKIVGNVIGCRIYTDNGNITMIIQKKTSIGNKVKAIVYENIQDMEIGNIQSGSVQSGSVQLNQQPVG